MQKHKVWHGMVWYGRVWYGDPLGGWLGAREGEGRLGETWPRPAPAQTAGLLPWGRGKVGYGGLCLAMLGYGMAWFGMVWFKMVQYGTVWYGTKWYNYCMVWCGGMVCIIAWCA